MRARLALTLAILAAGCSAGPTEPGPDTLTGRWEGTFSVARCEWTGTYTGCPGAIGTAFTAALLFLEPAGPSIHGFGQFSPYPADLLRRESLLNGFVRQFSTSLRPDGTLQMTGGWGKAPTVVYELQWDLKLATPARLEGTLRARSHWYKVQGDLTYLGTVVLTKKPD